MSLLRQHEATLHYALCTLHYALCGNKFVGIFEIYEMPMGIMKDIEREGVRVDQGGTRMRK